MWQARAIAPDTFQCKCKLSGRIIQPATQHHPQYQTNFSAIIQRLLPSHTYSLHIICLFIQPIIRPSLSQLSGGGRGWSGVQWCSTCFIFHFLFAAVPTTFFFKINFLHFRDDASHAAETVEWLEWWLAITFIGVCVPPGRSNRRVKCQLNLVAALFDSKLKQSADLWWKKLRLIAFLAVRCCQCQLSRALNCKSHFMKLTILLHVVTWTSIVDKHAYSTPSIHIEKSL